MFARCGYFGLVLYVCFSIVSAEAAPDCFAVFLVGRGAAGTNAEGKGFDPSFKFVDPAIDDDGMGTSLAAKVIGAFECVRVVSIKTPSLTSTIEKYIAQRCVDEYEGRCVVWLLVPTSAREITKRIDSIMAIRASFDRVERARRELAVSHCNSKEIRSVCLSDSGCEWQGAYYKCRSKDFTAYETPSACRARTRTHGLKWVGEACIK
jgi:hypothetical protein